MFRPYEENNSYFRCSLCNAIASQQIQILRVSLFLKFFCTLSHEQLIYKKVSKFSHTAGKIADRSSNLEQISWHFHGSIPNNWRLKESKMAADDMIQNFKIRVFLGYFYFATCVCT